MEQETRLEIGGKPYEDEELFRLINDRFEEAKKYRDDRKLKVMWDNYEKQYENRYWDGSGRARDLSRATSNNFFESVEVTLPVVTSRPPRPEITPEPEMIDPAYLEQANDYAEKVQRECVKAWKESGMDDKIQMGYREHSVKGTFLLKSTYDPENNKFVNEVADLYSIFPNPQSQSMEEAGKTWFIHAPIMSVEEVRQVYGIEVDPEGDLDEFQSYSYRERERGVRAVVESVREAITGKKKHGHVLVIEYYCTDVTEEDYEDYEYDTDGARKVDAEGQAVRRMESRMKYPNGRIITVIRNHKDWIVTDVANPYSRLPFVGTVNYQRSGDFWGTSEGKNIEDHVRMKNQILSNINDNIRYTGNPITEVVSGSGVKAVKNRPGSVIVSSIPNGVRSVPPPPMPSYIQNFVQYLDQDIDRKTGVTDAFRGMSQHAGDSGVKTQALIAQATGRLQPKVKSFVNFARELYQHWTHVIQNYYPEVVIQKTEDDMGAAQFEEFRPLEGANIRLKVDVSTESMLPFDNYAEWEEAKLLFESGNMSAEQLIDLAPSLRDKQRAKEFVAKRQQAEAEMMQQEAQAEQAAGMVSPEEQAILDGTDAEAIEVLLRQRPELIQLMEQGVA